MNTDSDPVQRGAEVVENFVGGMVDQLTTKLGIMGQVFFMDVGQGVYYRDLEIQEFLESQVEPVIEELNIWLDW